ncbi:RHS repeat domain-containing protein [Hymenobacter segetis]|uniref:RHS repeat-associated core domain-containing protein n=1 Tax=Hymenobacter segetis TaxID=2025509 RepID=A0ABU9LTW3_9BACT
MVITGLNSTDDPNAVAPVPKDDFAFAPLVNLAGGTQITFTDNGWQAAGSFRATEGIATYTAPASGVPRGTIISLVANRADFAITSGFELSVSGDQILAYQGSSANPSFVYALTTRGSGWTDATTSNTSALPPGLQNGTTAIAIPSVNAFMSVAANRQGTVSALRSGFSTAANWTGNNSSRVSWPTSSLQIQVLLITATTVAPEPGTAQTRVRELVFTEPNFVDQQLAGEILLTDFPGCGTPATKAALLYLRLDTGPVHNLGNAAATLSAQFNVSVNGCTAAGVCTTPLPTPLSSGVNLLIDGHTPQQLFVLDLASYLNANPSPGVVKLRVEINTLAVAPLVMRKNVRLVARLEQQLQVAPPALTTINPAPPTGGLVYDKFEYRFQWTSPCELVRNYQVQILKFAPGGTTATNQDWSERASLLETESSTPELTTVLAEGPGTYLWRVRAIGSADGGVANPDNWGTWANGSSISLAEPTTTAWTTNLNWIYSRTFSEGGRTAEHLTFANSLLHTRQSLTRLHLNGGAPILIGLQTLQDHVGRDALQSLPIPLQGNASVQLPGAAGPPLGFQPALLLNAAGTAYNANSFDGDNASTLATRDNNVQSPASATVQEGYYSGATSTAVPNEGVASAENVPFTRTLFTRDGTNRVREQGGAGSVLGLHALAGDTHTIRTSYGSVAQSELTRIFGPDEAPLAKNTYKIITQDPNNTTTVTYQTKEGQTIATALSASSGTPNLLALGSAAASTFKVVDHVNEKIPFGTTGSFGSKLLVVPPGGIQLKLAYTINHQTITDACGACNTCDYKAVITVRNVDTGMPQRQPYTYESPFIKCGLAEAPDKIPDLPLAQGTYSIEKSVVAYNNATNETTTWIDKRAAELRTTFAAYQAVGLWPSINALLTAKKVQDLYDLLDKSTSVTKVPATGPVQSYLVPFAPATAGCEATTIEIPKLDLTCGTPAIVCTPGKAGFESYLQDNAQTCYANFNTFFPGMQPGDLDKMADALMQDPLYNQHCDSLQNCWHNTIDSYEAFVQMSNTGGASTPLPDLLGDFLDCFRVKMRKVVPQGTTILPEERYFTFVFDDNNLGHQNCLRQYQPSAGNPTPPFILYSFADVAKLDPNDDKQLKILNDIYQCTRFSPNAPLPATGQNAGAFTQQQLDAMQASGEQRCEDRREEFRQAIIADFHKQNIYVSTDRYVLKFSDEFKTYLASTDERKPEPDDVEECEILFMVQELVDNCKTYCNLQVTQTASGLEFDQDKFNLFQSAMLDRADLHVKKIGADCQPGYAPIKLLPGPLLQTVRVSKTAEDLVNYINTLVHKANSISVDDPRRQKMGPVVGVQGLGEIEKGILCYVGPLEVAGNRLFNDGSTFAGLRRNYWVTVVDPRGDRTADIANPPLCANPNSTLPNALGSDFRVIWALDEKVATTFPYVCYARGEDVPGVPKLLTFPASSTFDYILRFLDDKGNPIPKGDITNISAPYAVAGSPAVTGYGDPLSTDGIYVILAMKGGGSQRAHIQLLPPAPYPKPATVNMSDADYLKQFMMWKDVQECRSDPRRFTTCFRWVKLVIPPQDPYSYEPVLPTCEGLVAATLTSNISAQQDTWIESRITDLRSQYAMKCASTDQLRDDLQVEYDLGFHHYTLYYYDRGGNLIKTVPPQGVDLVDLTTTPVRTPVHRMATTYFYNSLKQLEEQNTPDGGKTLFYYNRIGQLRFSLNDKQRAASVYSYTKYDNLGRVVEVGESSRAFTASLDLVLAQLETSSFPLNYEDPKSLPSTSLVGVPTLGGPTNQFVTQTVYNTPAPNLTYRGKAQRYLTNRISYVVSRAELPAKSVYTYYSYDPHGNVEWLVQQIPGLTAKGTRYEYDLISNKVLRVAYQEAQPDQFFHRYTYDDDNRLLSAYTSADGQIWDQDAHYEYYAHGPLKRLLLGQDQVQGLDYAYTLQGWLKGINHPNLDDTKDPGHDGTTSGAAKDAFGMTLGYFQGDYTRPQSFLNATATGSGTANPDLFEPSATQSLYNGNIATWQTKSRQDVTGNTAAAVQANELYQYDQLNRLRGSTQYDRAGNARTALGSYATTYTYDANGNLNTLKRRDQGGDFIDDFTYNYPTTGTGANAVRTNNKLLSVTDAAGASVTGDDLGTQTTDNYDYDATGNLIQDKQSGVTSITWTPYGKIDRIRKDDPAHVGSLAYATLIDYNYDATGNRVSKVYAAPGTNTRTTYYVRDAQGNMMGVYEQLDNATSGTSELRLLEQPLYGAARLGERKPNLLLPPAGALPNRYSRVLGLKQYELNDHLGNVRAVVTDEKLATVTNGTPDITSFVPKLTAYYNYYPFGMLQPNRYGPGNSTFSATGYRFGYNGKEKDNNGELGLTNYDYGARIYNPSVGRWLSLDPLQSKYPALSPYHAFNNNPNVFVDQDGKENIIYIYVSSSITTSVKKFDNVKLQKETERLLSIHGLTNVRVMIVNTPQKANTLDGSDTFVAVVGGATRTTGDKSDKAGLELNDINEKTASYASVGSGRFMLKGAFTAGAENLDLSSSNTMIEDQKNGDYGSNPLTPDIIGIKMDNVTQAVQDNGMKIGNELAVATIIIHGIIHNGGRSHIPGPPPTGTNNNDALTVGSYDGEFVFRRRETSNEEEKVAMRRQFPSKNKPADNREKKVKESKGKN